MGKTLLNKFGNIVKRSVLAGLIGLSFAACEPVINPIPNYTPTALFSAQKNSINVGENLSLTADGKDDNGKGDIIEYEIAEDKNGNNEIDAGEELIKQNSPIVNYSWTSTKAGTFKFIEKCKDKAGLTGKANLEIAVSDNVIPPVVQPKLPYVTLTGTDLIEGKTFTMSLPTPSDDDTAGIIPYTNAEIVNGNLTIDTSKLNENKLILNPNSLNQDTPYQIKLTFGTSGGGINTATFGGTEKNLLDITGNLQDVETLATQAGEVRIYDGTTLLSDINSTDGNFSFHASSPVAQVKLQARFNKVGGAETSYIRTLILDGTKDQDLTNGIRITKYGYSDGSPFDAVSFRNFMKEINISQSYADDLKQYGLSKFDLAGLNKIEILKYNPDSPTTDFFEDWQQQEIINKIGDLNDIPLLINNKKILGSLIQKDTIADQDSNKKYDSFIDPTSGHIIIEPKPGYVIVVPKKNLMGFVDGKEIGIEGKTDVYYNDRLRGVINKGKITIRPINAVVNNRTFSHEWEHLFDAPDREATILPALINQTAGSINKPAAADIKAGQIIYEKTYLPREKLDDILGMN